MRVSVCGECICVCVLRRLFDSAAGCGVRGVAADRRPVDGARDAAARARLTHRDATVVRRCGVGCLRP